MIKCTKCHGEPNVDWNGRLECYVEVTCEHCEETPGFEPCAYCREQPAVLVSADHGPLCRADAALLLGQEIAA